MVCDLCDKFLVQDSRTSFLYKKLGSSVRGLRHVATLPWDIKNSNFLQIFSRYGKMQRNCIFSAPTLIPLRNCVCWCIYVFYFIRILSSSLNAMLIVYIYCSDVCCGKFLMPQTHCKSKQIKEQWHRKFYLQSVWEKLLSWHLKYQNLDAQQS